MAIQCLKSKAVTFTRFPAKLQSANVMAKIPTAIAENILFLPIPLNKLICSVRILKPLNTAIKHNRANLAVIAAVSVGNIFAIGLNVITPYSAINVIVLKAILFFAPRINNPEPFLIGFSVIYSSLGGSPPNDNELRESMMIFTIRI